MAFVLQQAANLNYKFPLIIFLLISFGRGRSFVSQEVASSFRISCHVLIQYVCFFSLSPMLPTLSVCVFFPLGTFFHCIINVLNIFFFALDFFFASTYFCPRSIKIKSVKCENINNDIEKNCTTFNWFTALEYRYEILKMLS